MIESLIPFAPLIGLGVNALVLIVGGFISYGYYKKERELTREEIKGIKNKFINSEGRPILMSINECRDLRNSCQGNFNEDLKEYKKTICSKIEEIKAIVKDGDNKRELTREETSEKLERIAVFMGKVEQYMRDREKTI